jgi:hypothetical protein
MRYARSVIKSCSVSKTTSSGVNSDSFDSRRTSINGQSFGPAVSDDSASYLSQRAHRRGREGNRSRESFRCVVGIREVTGVAKCTPRPKRGSLVVGKVRAGVIEQCDIKVPRGIRQVGGRTRVSSSDDLQSTDDTSAFPFDLDDDGETPSGAAEAEMWAEELPNDSALLVVKRGRNAGARFLLNQPITTAGRLPGSDIFLDDVTVSRRHAEFRTEDGQHRVVDIGSLNKTYVNRRPVESAILTNGDEIQIGKFRLVFLKHCPPRVDPMAP